MGRTTVTLTGTGLTGASAVNFGATPATSFMVDSDTQITAVTPAGTGIESITVSGLGGTSNAVADTYVVVSRSHVGQPGRRTGRRGQHATITCAEFDGPLTVQFGITAQRQQTVVVTAPITPRLFRT